MLDVDPNLGKIDHDVVQVDRPGVLERGPARGSSATADAAAVMEIDDHVEVDGRLVKWIHPAIVGLEVAIGRAEPETFDAVVFDRSLERLEPLSVEDIVRGERLGAVDTDEAVGIFSLQIDDHLIGAQPFLPDPLRFLDHEHHFFDAQLVHPGKGGSDNAA